MYLYIILFIFKTKDDRSDIPWDNWIMCFEQAYIFLIGLDIKKKEEKVVNFIIRIECELVVWTLLGWTS